MVAVVMPIMIGELKKIPAEITKCKTCACTSDNCDQVGIKTEYKWCCCCTIREPECAGCVKAWNDRNPNPNQDYDLFPSSNMALDRLMKERYKLGKISFEEEYQNNPVSDDLEEEDDE